jgi:hypothetical protein
LWIATRALGELGSIRGTKCGEILRTDPAAAAAAAMSLVDDMPFPMHTPYASLLPSRIDCDVVVVVVVVVFRFDDRSSHPR